MTGLKYWDAAAGAWKTIVSVPGPTGPQGPVGPAGPTQAATLGNGRVMGIEAAATGTMAVSTDYPVDGKADGTQPIRLGPITPTYDCWWPVEAMLLIHTNETAWNGCNVDIWLTDNAWQIKADVDAVSKLTHRVFHYWTLPADWVSGSPKGMFKLAAGQTYGVKLVARPVQGTWVYYRGGLQHTWISSSGIVPR